MSAVGHAAAAPLGGADTAESTTLARRLLNPVLFVTVLMSSLAFVEPSPHDAMMLVLLVVCAGARMPFDRKLVPLFVLLAVWLVGGCLALIRVDDDAKAMQYIATSLYLGLAAITFACLFSDGNPARLRILGRAYVLAALVATALGFVGFFHLAPGADVFLSYERVSATFKDPNVYGPFLIFPLLWLVVGLLTRGVGPSGLLAVAALLGGLFLSFSRGAWIHLGVSAAVAIAILLAVIRDPRLRARIVVLGIVAAIATVLLVIALMSIDSVNAMFVERAKAIQPYDVGPGGRFWLQRLALTSILDHPYGLGPFEFDRIHGTQQHNVYMQGFLVYGWLGGAAYLTIVALTLVIGLRAAAVPTPWQYCLVIAYATFVGEAVEGMIVDTDHWRHFFLALGLIWGLATATINSRRRLLRSAPRDQNNPTRAAIAASQTRTARQSTQNTAAEP